MSVMAVVIVYIVSVSIVNARVLQLCVVCEFLVVAVMCVRVCVSVRWWWCVREWESVH